MLIYKFLLLLPWWGASTTVVPTLFGIERAGSEPRPFERGLPSLSERIESPQIILVLEIHFNAVLMKYTSQLRKNYIKREAGVLENLYSGTFKRLATLFSSKTQRPPQVTSYVPHKR